MSPIRSGYQLLRRTVEDFMEDGCPTLAAAISYYTVFSLPPLLILLLLIVGAVLDPEDVQAALRGQAAELMGPTAAREVEAIFRRAERPEVGWGPASLIGVAALLFGATGAFAQLQRALNRAWEVAPDPAQGGVRNFLLKRVLSFGMILAVAFLLLVSLVLSATLSAFGGYLADLLPGGISAPLLQGLNQAVSFAVIVVLFAAMFRVLPDAVVAWRDVWVGAAATALLFVGGKFLIGLYLGQSNPGEAYGAAAALVVILVWIYLSAMILLLGAEFTQSWAEAHGKGIRPVKGAVHVVEETRRIPEIEE